MTVQRPTYNEKENLLSADEKYNLKFDKSTDLEPAITHTRSRKNTSRFQTYFYAYSLFLHTTIIILYYRIWEGGTSQPLPSFSPAQSAIKYELQNLHHHHNSSGFNGPPSIDNGDSWDTLIRPIFFNVSAEELTTAGESLENKVELLVGGYEAALSVYHDLHCLVQLRLFVYQDYYYPNMTSAEFTYKQNHLDHCIESLRISTMCNGDISLYTFDYADPPTAKPITKTNAKRVCVNWDTLDAWSRERMLPVYPEKKLPGTST